MDSFTTRDGCTIAYRDTGSGDQTLVLLHGWSQSQAMFDRLRDQLGSEFRVITYDQRNHGRSGRIDSGARISSLAADLAELLDHLEIATAHMVGHSMGASVLWSYIDQHGTDRITTLTIVDQPSVCVLLPWVKPEEGAEVGAILDFAGADGFARALLGPESEAARRAFLTSMLTPDISPADFDFLYEENFRLPMDFGVKLLVDHVMQDWRDVLPRIGVPTLVTGGEVSHVVASSQAWTAAQIPGATLRVFTREEGGAHFPFFEAPSGFARALTSFTRSASPAAGATTVR